MAPPDKLPPFPAEPLLLEKASRKEIWMTLIILAIVSSSVFRFNDTQGGWTVLYWSSALILGFFLLAAPARFSRDGIGAISMLLATAMVIPVVLNASDSSIFYLFAVLLFSFSVVMSLVTLTRLLRKLRASLAKTKSSTAQ